MQMLPNAEIGKIVASVLERCGRPPFEVPVGISGRHVHLSQEDQDILFGRDYAFHLLRNLSQKGQYANEETVLAAGPRGALPLRVLGPVRAHTQVELLASDAYPLGLRKLPVCESGTREPSPALTLIGPKGAVTLTRGVMAAWRHIHMDPEFAARVGARDGGEARVRAASRRGLVFENVMVRVGPLMTTELHIDTDEANACGLKNGDRVQVTLYEP